MATERKRMRAAVLDGPHAFRVAHVPVPEPGPGEVRVCLEGSGVCASNLTPWEGSPWVTYPFPPGSPGHEGWGIVDAVGDGVTRVTEGDRVVAIFDHAFAEWDVTAADTVVPVPEALADVPVPAEPLACAFNAFKRSGITAGSTVAVVGVGFLGAVLTRLAVDAGARVIAITRRDDALRVAERYGAMARIPLTDRGKVVERVGTLTDGALCDVVVECTGKQMPLDLAAEITRERGRLVIVGYHQDGPREVNMQLWNWRGLDVVNAHERAPQTYVAGMKAALEAVSEGRFDPTPLYTHTYALEDIGRAFEALETRPDGFMKALVVP